jgi:hypothetical protein
MVTSANEKRPTSAFKNGSLRDHYERTRAERTTINKDNALNIALYFRPDLKLDSKASRQYQFDLPHSATSCTSSADSFTPT